GGNRNAGLQAFLKQLRCHTFVAGEKATAMDADQQGGWLPGLGLPEVQYVSRVGAVVYISVGWRWNSCLRLCQFAMDQRFFPGGNQPPILVQRSQFHRVNPTWQIE